MMYVLDTDHLSILDQDTAESGRLSRRLAGISPEDVFVTIVTYEEQMRGWLSYLAQSKTAARQVAAYRKLRRHVERYRAIPLLDYDERAASIVEQITSARVHAGTMDPKIDAIALANDATLLTRNTGHFDKVPGLRFENWVD